MRITVYDKCSRGLYVGIPVNNLNLLTTQDPSIPDLITARAKLNVCARFETDRFTVMRDVEDAW